MLIIGYVEGKEQESHKRDIQIDFMCFSPQLNARDPKQNNEIIFNNRFWVLHMQQRVN
jgi:hypothetical protein